MPDGQQLWRDRIDDIIALQLTGSIEQVPNTFSAIKINGQRAYDLARDGKDVQLKARRITVSAFGVLDVRFGYAPTRQLGLPLVSAADGRATTERDDAEATPVIDVDVRVSCSAGTYIRALGRDLGAALGVGGHLIRLRRTRVGRFRRLSPRSSPRTWRHASTPTATATTSPATAPCSMVIGDELAGKALTMLDAARGTMPLLAITDQDAVNLRYGRRIPYDIHGTAAAYLPQSGEVVALVERAKRGEAKPATVFGA